MKLRFYITVIVSSVLFHVSCAQIGLQEEKKDDSAVLLALAAAGAAAESSDSSGPVITAVVPMTFNAADMPSGVYTIETGAADTAASISSVEALAVSVRTLIVSANPEDASLTESETEFPAGTYTVKSEGGTVMFVIEVKYNGNDQWTATVTAGITVEFGMITTGQNMNQSGFYGSCTSQIGDLEYCINYYSTFPYKSLPCDSTSGASENKCPAQNSVGSCSFKTTFSGYSLGYEYVWYKDYYLSASAYKEQCDLLSMSYTEFKWSYYYNP